MYVCIQKLLQANLIHHAKFFEDNDDCIEDIISTDDELFGELEEEPGWEECRHPVLHTQEDK